MRYWEILVFCLGISLDVFGAAVCQGAVLGELACCHVRNVPNSAASFAAAASPRTA